MARRKYFNRSKILDRDERQCQDCGSTHNLEIHHIDGDPSNNHPSNAKTVCKDCHWVYTRQLLGEKTLQHQREWEEVEAQNAEAAAKEGAKIAAAYEAYGDPTLDWGIFVSMYYANKDEIE